MLIAARALATVLLELPSISIMYRQVKNFLQSCELSIFTICLNL
jgi:hypothetical protein